MRWFTARWWETAGVGERRGGDGCEAGVGGERCFGAWGSEEYQEGVSRVQRPIL
jgi:hypothetical protein